MFFLVSLASWRYKLIIQTKGDRFRRWETAPALLELIRGFLKMGNIDADYVCMLIYSDNNGSVFVKYAGYNTPTLSTCFSFLTHT